MNGLYVYLRIYAPFTPLMNTLGCIGMTLQSTTEIISATWASRSFQRCMNYSEGTKKYVLIKLINEWRVNNFNNK